MKLDTKAAKSKMKHRWLVVSGLFFLLSFTASAVFVLFGKRFESLGIIGDIYYIILIPLGFSSAAFLAGAMKSYASFQSNNTLAYGKLQLTGPIVIFVLVVGGGFILPTLNQKAPFPIKVRILSIDKATYMFNQGKIFLYIGQERKSADIHDGEAKFENIPVSYSNKRIKVLPVIENYQLADSSNILISNKIDYVDIKVVRTKQSLITNVRGTIVNDKNVPVRNALVNFGSGLATAYTDQNGDFLLTVPLSSGEKVPLKILVDDLVLFNEAVTLSSSIPINLKLSMHQ